MSSLFRGASHSLAYSSFRFSPPNVLVERIIQFLTEKTNLPLQKAVDIGCGSGQSTIILAPYFKSVTGLDVSDTQIEFAVKSRAADNISYRVSDAHQTGFEDSSVELITVGQALHWFDQDKFYAEAKRILQPTGVFAVYGYWLPIPKVQGDQRKNEFYYELIKNHLHDKVLGEYWDNRRYDVLRYCYESINLPFRDAVKENFTKESTYTVSDYIGYLSSWSAYQELRKQDSKKAEAVLQDIQDRLMEISGASTEPQEANLTVFADFFLHMGRKEQ